MNLIFFFFLNCRKRLKRRRLILVRLSLMNMRPLGWALLWERSRCLWLNTASLVFLEQNLAMMADCGFLSEAGDSLWETLISSSFKSSPTIFETRRIRSSVFSFLFQASPWNSGIRDGHTVHGRWLPRESGSSQPQVCGHAVWGPGFQPAKPWLLHLWNVGSASCPHIVQTRIVDSF